MHFSRQLVKLRESLSCRIDSASRPTCRPLAERCSVACRLGARHTQTAALLRVWALEPATSRVITGRHATAGDSPSRDRSRNSPSPAFNWLHTDKFAREDAASRGENEVLQDIATRDVPATQQSTGARRRRRGRLVMFFAAWPRREGGKKSMLARGAPNLLRCRFSGTAGRPRPAIFARASRQSR